MPRLRRKEQSLPMRCVSHEGLSVRGIESLIANSYMMRWGVCRTCGSEEYLINHCADCLNKLRVHYLTHPEYIAEVGHVEIESKKCSVAWCKWDAAEGYEHCSSHCNEIEVHGNVLPPMDGGKYMSASELTEMLGLCGRSMDKMMSNRDYVSIRHGGRTLILVEDWMHEWAEEYKWASLHFDTWDPE